MKGNGVTRLAAAVCIWAAASSAHAHHSDWIFFDLCTSVTIEGQVERIQWQNPHTWIDLKADDGMAYSAEWTSLTSGGAGPAREVLKAGDRLVIAGSPPRDPAMRRDSARRVVSALTQIRRLSDGWSWERAPGTTPPSALVVSRNARSEGNSP
jgi:hypothetical protein